MFNELANDLLGSNPTAEHNFWKRDKLSECALRLDCVVIYSTRVL